MSYCEGSNKILDANNKLNKIEKDRNNYKRKDKQSEKKNNKQEGRLKGNKGNYNNIEENKDSVLNN